MPRTRKDEAPLIVDEAEITGRYVELGDYTVSFEAFHTEFDPAPLFRGLPDDRCQCTHLGVVISGKIEVRYPDRTEIYTAGDAYVIEPGHLPWPHSGSEVIEFTKTAEVAKTQAVVGANMAAQGASA